MKNYNTSENIRNMKQKTSDNLDDTNNSTQPECALLTNGWPVRRQWLDSSMAE